MVPGDVWDYIYFVESTKNNSSSSSWFIEDYEEHTKVLAVFEDLGYVYWNVVVEQRGCVKKYNLKPFLGTLVLPWELHDSSTAAPSVEATVLPSHQMQSQETFSTDLDKRGTLERPVLMVLNYLCHLIHDTPFVPLSPPVRLPEISCEEEALRFLANNGFSQCLKEGYVWCEPTQKDLKNFQCRHGMNFRPPTLMFVVPYEEYPLDDVYAPNGVAHLSYRDVARWLQQREAQIEMQKIPRTIYAEYNTCVPKSFRGGQLDHLLKLTSPYFVSGSGSGSGSGTGIAGAKGAKGAKGDTKGSRGSFSTGKAGAGADTRVPHITDMEDLMRCAPPCLANKLREKKWYKDQERVQLVAQLRCGGVEEQVVQQLFERASEYNENYKKNGWDYKYAWDKGYIGAKCEVFIENANRNIGDTIQCPYKCKETCLANFKATQPTLARAGDQLKRPFSILLWHARRRHKKE